jgi:hypothetical protein
MELFAGEFANVCRLRALFALHDLELDLIAFG